MVRASGLARSFNRTTITTLRRTNKLPSVNNREKMFSLAG
jgi:hypothetical protein